MDRIENLGQTLRWCLDKLIESGARSIRIPLFSSDDRRGNIEFENVEVLDNIVSDDGSGGNRKVVGRFRVHADALCKRPARYIEIDKVLRILNLCHDMADAANCLLSYEVTEGKCWYLYVSCDSNDLRDFESIDATTELLSTIDHGNYLAHTLVKVKGGVEYHFYLYQDVDGDESQEDRVVSVYRAQ